MTEDDASVTNMSKSDSYRNDSLLGCIENDDDNDSVIHGELFQTPFSVRAFARNFASSTPMMNSRICNVQNDNDTPCRKRTLFSSSSGSSYYYTPVSNVKYLPLSSPTTSECVKLNDSHILNESSVLLNCNSTIDQCKLEQTYSVNVTPSSKLDIEVNDYNKTNVFNNSDISIQNECRVRSKPQFDSFDLLPGIRPLNDSDVI